MKMETTEAKLELGDLESLQPHFDATPIQDGQDQFQDLDSLSNAIIKGGQDKFFQVGLLFISLVIDYHHLYTFISLSFNA